MEKISGPGKPDKIIGRKIFGINLRKDVLIFQPDKKEKKDFKNFYNDLDRKRKSKTSFIWTMLIILLILFALLIYGFWSLRKISFSTGNNKDAENSYLTETVSKSLEGKKTGDLITVEISEPELANFIGVGAADFPLKKSSLEIRSDGIYISGRTGSGILSLPVTIVAIPKADGGNLKIELSKASSGLVTLPLALKNSLNKYFEDQVGTYTSDIGRINVTEVLLKDRKMNLIGTAL